MGTVREFSTVWGECGGSGGREVVEPGRCALSLFAKEVYAGLCRALFSLGSIFGCGYFCRGS